MSQQPAEHTPEQRHQRHSQHTGSARGTILVVDDEPGVLLTIKAILAQEGYTVDGAANGAAAFDRLSVASYDLVLTDLRLGDMDGLEVLAEVRRVSPRTVAIVLTGYASLESAIQAMREGAYDYLVKPTDVEELKLRVAHIFERLRLADELAQRVKELEAANTTIARMNATLHGEVEAATAQIRAQLEELEAAKSAQEAVQAQKERFIAMVAHELRGPLSPIKFGAQVMARHPERVETVANYTVTIEQQVDRLERLIVDLLDVTRIDSGRFSIKIAPFDLVAMVRQQIEDARLTHADRVFILHAPEMPLPGNYDRGRIEQALGNLLDNAVKYSLEDTIITTSLACVGDDWITLSVADEGKGIPPDQIEKYRRSLHSSQRDRGNPGLRAGTLHHEGHRGGTRRPSGYRERHRSLARRDLYPLASYSPFCMSPARQA